MWPRVSPPNLESHWSANFEGTTLWRRPMERAGVRSSPDPHLRWQGGPWHRSQGSVSQAAPAPRFSATPLGPAAAATPNGRDTIAILTELGYSESAIGMLQIKEEGRRRALEGMMVSKDTAAEAGFDRCRCRGQDPDRDFRSQRLYLWRRSGHPLAGRAAGGHSPGPATATPPRRLPPA